MLQGLPRSARILLRRPWSGQPGFYEQAVAAICRMLGIEYEWRLPLPAQGRQATFYRDIQMVADSDAVIVFFAPDAIMEGGTAHLVEKALDQSVPVYAYSADEERVTRVGEHDTEDEMDPIRWLRDPTHI
jgi:nucleoside 2-deoxyribosyltransferase